MTQPYNAWLCVENYENRDTALVYIQGLIYHFHEDSGPPDYHDFDYEKNEGHFAAIVDEQDVPVKILTRGRE